MEEKKNDYYEALKNESYKSMLNSEIQASVARDQALKYTNNALRSSGYASQGLSQTAYNGITNNYQNALQQANQQYQNDLTNINQQQRNEQKATGNDNFNSLTTLMSGASSSDELNQMLNTYGYGSFENGAFNWNGDNLKNLDSNSLNQLKILYNMYNSQLTNNEWLSSNTINGNGFKDVGNAIANIVDANGDTGKVSNELRYIFSEDYLKNAVDGQCVKLVNGGSTGDSDKNYVYMIYKNGSWYQTNGTVYANAGVKEVIKGK